MRILVVHVGKSVIQVGVEKFLYNADIYIYYNEKM